MEQNEGTIDLSRLFRVMGARWKTVTTLVLSCTLVALIFAFVLSKEYESTTLVQTRSTGNSSAMWQWQPWGLVAVRRSR